MGGGRLRTISRAPRSYEQGVLDLRDRHDHAPWRRQRHRQLASPELVRATRRAIRLGRIFRVGLVAVDAAILALAAYVAGVHRPAGVLFVVLVLAALWVTRAYRERISPMVGEEVPVLAARLAVPAILVGAVLADGSDVQAVLRAVIYAWCALFLVRLAAYALIRWARRRGVLCEPTLIVGAGQQAMVMAQTLKDHPEYGLVPVGFVDDVDEELEPPVVGNASQLETLLEGQWIRRIIVAFGATRESELVSVLRAADRHGVEVHVLPRFFELGVVPLGGYTDVVWGIPLIQVRRAALRKAAQRAKRALDLVVASVALALTLPVLVCIAVLIKVASPGPVLFRQKRVGQRGNQVEIFKFRTLPVNSDADLTWSVEHDPRVGRFGRFLRRTSLDELPQLVNVLRGDMSIVGPRPERRVFVDAFDRSIPRYGDRHRVPVGMTGWAQIHRLRGNTSIEERARFDNFYIENWSLWRDVLIMLRTLPAMVVRPSRIDRVPARSDQPAPQAARKRPPDGEDPTCSS